MRLDAPVMVMLLLGAAAAQTLLPPVPGTFLKFPLLVGVASYYALSRPLVIALLAACWAGILADGSGGVPTGTTPIVLGVLALLVAAGRQVLPEASWGMAAALGGLGASLLVPVQALALARQAYRGVSAWSLAGSMLLLAPAGALAAGLIWRLGRRLDLLAGNITPRKEVETRDG